MAYDRIIGVLCKINNTNKFLTEFNNIPLKDKLIILSNDKVKKKVISFCDTPFLVSLLIDLPADFRISFLKTVNIENFKKKYDSTIIDFLMLENYNDFDHSKLESFKELKDKQALATMLKRLSSNILKEIIIANYSRTVTNYTFLELSRKEPDFELEASLINNVDNGILFLEMKKRKLKDKNTSLSIEEFIKLDGDKQKGILLNGDLRKLEDEIILAFEERNKHLTADELSEYFKKSLVGFNYMRLVELQTIISVIDDEHATKLMKLFFKEILHFDCEVDQRYLRSMIYIFRKQSEKTAELYTLSKTNQYTIINYLNTGIIDEKIKDTLSQYISYDQYQKINNKKLNKIIKLFDSKFPGNSDIILCYKMYFILGYDNTIELLNNKFGKIDNVKILQDLFSECNVINVPFKSVNNSYEPNTNEDIVQFLVGDKKDDNITIKRILRGEIDTLIDGFSTLYNNVEEFQSKIGKRLHLNKVLTLLKENPYQLLPTEYKFTKDIVNDIINSYESTETISNLSEKERIENRKKYVKEACDFYHTYLENRTLSAIPRVFGKTEDDYSYEVLRLNDPTILTLGYKTGCCFRLNGQSKEFLQYCSESPYGRVIVIRNQFNEICAMIPIIRNGNVIAGNSIESNSKGNNNKIYDALKAAYDEIIQVTIENEEDPVIACTVTNLHNNCSSTMAFGKDIFPIRDHEFYTNYTKKPFIVSKQREKTHRDFRSYHPRTLYYDDRPPILISSFWSNNLTLKEEISNRIRSVNYKLGYPSSAEWFSTYVACSDDWYLKISIDEYGEYLTTDPRAKEEYYMVKTYVSNIFGQRYRKWELTDEEQEEIRKPKMLEKRIQLKSDSE